MISPTTEALGIISVTMMVVSYALEKRGNIFIAIFAVGCALAAFYAYLLGSYPFLFAEGIWSVIAFRRFYTEMKKKSMSTS
ncbi:hypothetical protein MNBD_NITROSPIRAE01-1610 [hydrothermal vent metagenome]|uniref:Uncharacterized protein n=1 Tax=hydrothermal vent metagenome TaxID=652676 RepID=A0A3B1DFG5_9ZZZZ